MKGTHHTTLGDAGRATHSQAETAEPTGSAETATDAESLVTALRSKNVLTRQHAREGLVAIGSPAVGPLVGALKDRRQMVRWEAAKALGEIADPSAAAAMVTILEDEDAGVRWLAAEGLTALGRDGVMPLLHALAKNSDSEWLQQGAHHVFHALIRRKWAKPLAPVLAALESSVPHLATPVAAHKTLYAMEKGQ